MLEKEVQELILEVIAFAQEAYAPYSHFKVSAGLRLKSGKIVKGTNVENASYPISVCAERALIAHTVSNYRGQEIDYMAIYVDKDFDEPVPPCGMCRQALLETEQNQKNLIKIYLVAKGGKIVLFNSCGDMLPLHFSGDIL